MVNFFNQFFLKRIYKGPSIHFIKPKTLNIRFKGNLLPNYTFMDLSDIFLASPELLKNESEHFEIKINITKKDNTKQSLIIGLFNNEQLARQAYALTINSFFSPTHSIIKFFLTIIIISIGLQLSTGYIMNVTNAIGKRNNELQMLSSLKAEKARELKNMKEGLLKNSLPPFAQPFPLNQDGFANLNGIKNSKDNSDNADNPDNKPKFQELNKSLDSDIEQVRKNQSESAIKESASSGDLLLKEFSNK